MMCPICKSHENEVKDTRDTESGTAIRRRRYCACGHRWSTRERIDLPATHLIPAHTAALAQVLIDELRELIGGVK